MLVNLRPSSGIDACVSDVHVYCIAAGAPHRRVFLNPHERLLIPTFCDAGVTRAGSVGCVRRHILAPAPCRLLHRTFAKALATLPPSGSSDPGGRAASGSWSREAVCTAYRSWLTSLPTNYWDFPKLVVNASCAAIACRPLGALGSGPPLRLDPNPTKIRGRFLSSLPSLPPVCLEYPASHLRAER